MNKIVINLLSLTTTACLYFGEGSVHKFAFYFIAITTVLAGIALFTSLNNSDVQRSPMQAALNAPFTIAQVVALAITGYPGWAAALAIISMLLYTKAIENYKKNKVAK